MPKLVDEVRDLIRVRHYSIQTEGRLHTLDQRACSLSQQASSIRMAERKASNFLSHLAVNRRVAASTQTQAFSVLLFLYRNGSSTTVGPAE